MAPVRYWVQRLNPWNCTPELYYVGSDPNMLARLWEIASDRTRADSLWVNTDGLLRI